MPKSSAAVRFWFAVIALVPALAVGAGSRPASTVIPAPLHLVPGRGRVTLNKETVVRYSEGARREAEFFAALVRVPTGLPLPTEELSGTASNAIDFALDSAHDEMGAEGYRLRIASNRVQVNAATTAGLFYAGETLRQLLPVEAFSDGPAAGVKWYFPCLEINDKPRFAWRGMHLDVSRHFYPADFIKKYIDLLAIHKMNVFHWHLIDDGGWRLEIKKYPLLTRRGAWRSSPPKGSWDYGKIVFPEQRDGTEYGGFYTQEEVRDIVRYAADRHITIVPEIEMPGHTWPSISAYPKLGCDLPSGFRIPSSMPGDNVYCAGKEEVFQFLEDVLTETMELFPSQYIHIGGDEVDRRFWNACPLCKARMQQEGLKDVGELQSYFIRRIDRFLTENGRKLIGWDEILDGGLARGATVMSWRGIDGGIEAVRQGRQAIMTPTSHCYFDYAYSTTPVERVYEYEPVPEEVADRAGMILGAQGNVWTEWMPESTDVERMAFPRAAAMAEVTWSAQGSRDLGDFMRRLAVHYARLDSLGVHYRIPPPEASTNAILFDKSVKVSFAPAPIPGWQLRYTVDGSPPTVQSRLYQGAIKVNADTDVKASLFRADGAGSEVTTVSCRKYKPDVTPDTANGLQAAYYEGRWSRIPDFGALTPVSEQAVDAVDLSARRRQEYYALKLTGFLHMPRKGTYTFTLASDDGSRLIVGGALVVDHDGPHATSEKSGKITLPTGTIPFEVDYFQASGGASLALSVEGPGMDRRVVGGELVGK